MSCNPFTAALELNSRRTLERACEPRHEPNYAVNLELAELVNKKKANRWVQTHIPG